MGTQLARHAHPLTIFFNLGQVLYLTIIPVLRGFFFALQGDLAQWVQSAWIDILVFVAMLVLAAWRWWVVRYTFTAQGLRLHTGWLMRKQIFVSWKRITTISSYEAFYLRPFYASWLRADTIGGSAGKADFSILVWRDDARHIIEQNLPQGEAQQPWKYVPRTRSIWSLSLLTSNSLAGILFIATFVSQSGRLLGEEFSDILIDTFEEAARMLAFGLPPAAAAIGYILLAGWFIGFFLTFMRYKNFEVARRENLLSICGGALSTRHYNIHYDDINFIDIRQSITTKLLRLYSLYVSAVGYAKRKDDISCVIPTENQRVFSLNRRHLFPTFIPSARQIVPKARGILRYIGVALCLCAAIPLATVIVIWIFPNWRDFSLFVGVMSTIPAVLFLVIRIIDFSTAGVSATDSCYTLRYSKGFYLHTIIIPKDKVVSVEFRKSFFQRFTPYCDLIIGTRAENRVHHRCRNLDMASLQKLFQF